MIQWIILCFASYSAKDTIRPTSLVVSESGIPLKRPPPVPVTPASLSVIGRAYLVLRRLPNFDATLFVLRLQRPSQGVL